MATSSTLRTYRIGGQIDPAWVGDRPWSHVRAVATLSTPPAGAPIVDPTNGAHEHPLTVTSTLTAAQSDGMWSTAALKPVTAPNPDDALQPTGLTWTIGIEVKRAGAWVCVQTYVTQLDGVQDYAGAGELVTVAGVQCVDINALIDDPITSPPTATFVDRVRTAIEVDPGVAVVSAGAADAGELVALDGAGKLDPSVLPAGQYPANLSIANRTTTALDVVSSSGTDATLPAATGSLAGVMSATDKAKLDTIEPFAAADQVAAEVPVTPSGGLASANVQAALAEHQGDIDTLTASVAVAASEAGPGRIEIATQPETDAGTDDVRAVTPLKLKTTLGTVLRQNISGGTTLNIAGRSAAELTMIGNVDWMVLTGWVADSTRLQRVRIEIRQDATGGRQLTWHSIAGRWMASPPDTLETAPTATTLQFWASTTDGGTTVWLEPLGLVYQLPQAPVQAAESVVPVVAAGGGELTISHPFSMVTSAVMVDQATGERVEPDWKHLTPADPSSDLVITFDSAVAANSLKLRVAGVTMVTPKLTVVASEWEQVTLSVAGATTIVPRVDWVGTATGLVQWVWGDGSMSTAVNSVGTSKTYASAYTGPVTLRWKRGTKLIRFMSNSHKWSFDIGTLVAAMPFLSYIELQDNLVTGEIDAFGACAMTSIYLATNPNLGGSVSAAVAGSTALTAFSAPYCPRITGDFAGFAGKNTITDINLSVTAVNGNISPLASLTSLASLRLISSKAFGNVGALAAARVATLTALEYYAVGVTPTTAELDAALVALAAGTRTNGLLNLHGANPAITATAAKATLQGRGWTVNTN